LNNGWDISGFYYRSMDAAPTFYRDIVAAPAPAFVYQARHDRIAQGGATLTKDFDAFVLKGELVYTRGRSFDVSRLSDADGVVAQNTLDWMLRPRLAWDFRKNWRLRFGVVVFKGPPLGFFGQFDNRDRVYAELRYSF
jgi:hypothetical protein